MGVYAEGYFRIFVSGKALYGRHVESGFDPSGYAGMPKHVRMNVKVQGALMKDVFYFRVDLPIRNDIPHSLTTSTAMRTSSMAVSVRTSSATATIRNT